MNDLVSSLCQLRKREEEVCEQDGIDGEVLQGAPDVRGLVESEFLTRFRGVTPNEIFDRCMQKNDHGSQNICPYPFTAENAGLLQPARSGVKEACNGPNPPHVCYETHFESITVVTSSGHIRCRMVNR